MPRVRIEWMPVQLYGLGHLGFDHLQLVFEPGAGGAPQDEWFVIEGVRDPTDYGVFLGVEGADGRTTLASANLASRHELTQKIGTPELRGSRALPLPGDEFRTWETMSSYAREIEDQDFPYIAFGLPGSSTPTVNSSSVVASLIHYAGLDPTMVLPYGMRISPGMSTLLGTSDDDVMRTEGGFTTLLGGRGNDVLEGSGNARQTEKFYGGVGNDMFRWSPGFNIIHGGQPQLDYARDGTDVIDYSGADEVTITFNRHWVAHKTPNFIATHQAGVDHLYSVERIQWNEKTDRIELGRGINLLEDNRVLQPHAGAGATTLRTATLMTDDEAVAGGVAASGAETSLRITGSDKPDTIEGKGGDDTLYGGGGDDVLIGGDGSDGYVYMAGDGNDVIIDLGQAEDVDELLLSGGISAAGIQAFCVDARDLLLVVPDGSILVTEFFAIPGAGIDRITFEDGSVWTREDISLHAIAIDGDAAADIAAHVAIAEAGGAPGRESVDLQHEPHLFSLF